MPLLRTLGNVIANLAARADLTDVRPEQNAEASAIFKSRLVAVQSTELFLQQVRPQVQPALHAVLDRSVAHTDVPVISLSALLECVRVARTGQAVAVGRSGWSESHPEAKYADDLAALALALDGLLSGSTVHGASPSASSESSRSAA